MNFGFIMRVVCAAAYAAIFSFIYINYLNTIPGADFPVIPKSATQFYVSIALTILPVVFYKRSWTLGAVQTVFIYSLYYVPSVLISHFYLNESFEEVLILQASLAITMSGLFVVARYPASTGECKPILKRHLNLIYGIMVFLILAVVATYGGHMRLVSFADVYDLRFETNAIEKNPLIGYFVLQLSYCLLPFALARGILYREVRPIALGLAGCLIIYASTGSKAVILTPVIIIGVYVLLRLGSDLLLNSLIALIAICAAVIWLVPDNFILVKALIFVRVLATAGQNTVLYYNFFLNHPHTHLAQIGLVNALTGWYPYGSLQLGQLFGIAALDQSLNAGFWASEGIASFGIPGIFFASALLAAILMAMNALARKFDPMLIALWSCGFGSAILNSPISTTMVSAGGGSIIALLLLFRTKRLLSHSTKLLPPLGVRS